MANRSRRDMTVLRHSRLRKNVSGTSERPRLAIFRSNLHLYAQVIDDTSGRTLASANTLQAGLKTESAGKPALDKAKLVGGAIATAAKAAGVSKVVFDRGGYKYHGCVKALADSAREGGLEF
ncbi:50S ribosomal protein L18 [bacterium]|nr:50S ribosomal protein L18 [bacterium]